MIASVRRMERVTKVWQVLALGLRLSGFGAFGVVLRASLHTKLPELVNELRDGLATHCKPLGTPDSKTENLRGSTGQVASCDLGRGAWPLCSPNIR